MAISTILWPIPLRALLASVSRRERARGGGREAARDGAAARTVGDDAPSGHLARDAVGGGGRQLGEGRVAALEEREQLSPPVLARRRRELTRVRRAPEEQGRRRRRLRL